MSRYLSYATSAIPACHTTYLCTMPTILAPCNPARWSAHGATHRSPSSLLPTPHPFLLIPAVSQALTADCDYSILRQAYIRLAQLYAQRAERALAASMLAAACKASAALRLLLGNVYSSLNPKLPAPLRAALPDWSLPMPRPMRLGAVASAQRDISKALPMQPAAEAVRAGATMIDIMHRRAAMERARSNGAGASSLADANAIRANRLQQVS